MEDTYTMPKVTPAQQKRYDGMAAVYALALEEDPGMGTHHRKEDVKASTIAEAIRGLKTLGRTDRWKGRCEQWARMVEGDWDQGSTWGLFQGGIYANMDAQ